MKRGIWVGDLGCLTEGSCLGFQSTMEGCHCVSPVAMYASAATLTNRRICMQLEGMSYNSTQSRVGAGGGRGNNRTVSSTYWIALAGCREGLHDVHDVGTRDTCCMEHCQYLANATAPPLLRVSPVWPQALSRTCLSRQRLSTAPAPAARTRLRCRSSLTSQPPGPRAGTRGGPDVRRAPSVFATPCRSFILLYVRSLAFYF